MDHAKYLEEALKLARKAYKNNEVPIGAVVVDANGEIIGKGYNRTNKRKNAFEHAEIMAIQAAAKSVGDWRLEKARLYVTLEPCLMCLGAALISRVKEVHFVVSDPTFGSIKTVLNQPDLKGAYKGVKFVQHPELSEKVEGLLKEFFVGLRKKK